MKFQIQCNDCKARAWVKGKDDPSVNAVDLDFDKPIEWDDTREDVTSHECDHSGEYTVIDEEHDDDD